MFTKGPGELTDSFGPNQYLRSTKGAKFKSGTLRAESIPTETINGYDGKRLLQRGEVLAKITSGPEAGGVGPFQLGATDGRQTTANIVGFSDTYVPWRANVRDVPVGICYEGAIKKGWTFIRDTDGKRIPLTDAVATAIARTERTSFTFH